MMTTTGMIERSGWLGRNHRMATGMVSNQARTAGQLYSVQFLKELLDLATENVVLEKQTPPQEDEGRARPPSPPSFRRSRTANARHRRARGRRRG